MCTHTQYKVFTRDESVKAILHHKKQKPLSSIHPLLNNLQDYISQKGQRSAEEREPIKRMHTEPAGLFVSTLGPQPDKLITTQNITSCPIHSDLTAYTGVSGNAEISDP